jgi:hypothetical protein
MVLLKEVPSISLVLFCASAKVKKNLVDLSAIPPVKASFASVR